MPKYVDVELTTGEKVRVYQAPGLKLRDLLVRQYPDPEAPIQETTTASGRTMKMAMVEDPEYLAEKRRVEELRSDKLEDLITRATLKDIEVPDKFDIEEEVGYIARLADPEWKPREGELGQWIDYIDWVVLANSVDALRIQEATIELSGIDLESIRQIEDSFPNILEGETA